MTLDLQLLMQQLFFFIAALQLNLLVLFFGWAILGEYVRFLCRRATFRKVPSKRWRRKLGAAVGLLCMSAFYVGINAVIGNLLAVKVVNMLPPGEESIGTGVGVGAGFFLVSTGRILRARREYLEFRKFANFRAWVRRIDANGIAAAHSYYISGWVQHQLEERWFLAVFMTMFVYILRVVAQAPAHGDWAARDWVNLGEVVGLWVALVIVKRMIFAAWIAVRPDRELIATCMLLTPKILDSSKDEEVPRQMAMRPGRSRNSSHTAGFRAAELVENCLSGMGRRFSRDAMERVLDAGRRIAESLRMNALHAEDSIDAFREFQDQLILALRVVTSFDPVEYVAPIFELTAGQSEPPAIQRRKFAKIAESINDGIGKYWSSFRVLLLVAGILFFVVLGRFSEVAGLLGK